MRETFGMDFVDKNGLELGMDGDASNLYRDEEPYGFLKWKYGDTKDDFAYIEPESLPLLELRIGDRFSINGEDAHTITHQDMIDTIIANEWRFTIDKRDGKPFIWPKEQQAGEL